MKDIDWIVVLTWVGMFALSFLAWTIVGSLMVAAWHNCK